MDKLVLNMEITTYSKFRQHLKEFLDNIFTTRTPLYVKRVRGEDVVVLSKSDYESMEETLYLLSSENNRNHLVESMKQAEQGETITVDMKDLWK